MPPRSADRSPEAARAERAPPGRGLGGLAALGLAVVALGWDPSATAWAVKSTLLALGGLVALGVGFARVRARFARRARLPPAVTLWLAWLGWMLLSNAWARHPVPAVAAAWAGAGALALGTSTLERSSAERLGRVVAATMIVGSAAACLVETALGASASGRHGLAGNPNWLGLVVASAAPLGLEQAWRDGRARRWLRAALVVAATALALAVARSRVAWVALGAGGLFFAMARRRPAGGSWGEARSARWGLVALGLALAAAVLGLALAFSLPLGTLATDRGGAQPPGALDGAMAALRGRLWIWRASAAVAWSNLPLGVGLGDFQAAFLAEQGPRLASLPPERAATTFVNATTAHGDWLELGATAGPLGVGLLAASIGVALRAARADWPAAAASLVVVAVAALGDSAIVQPALLLIVALVLGTSCPESRAQPGPPRRPDGRVRAVGLGVTHAFAWLATILLMPLGLRAWMVERTLAAADELEPGARLAALEAAVRIDDRSAQAWLRLGLGRLELGRPDAALEALERARATGASLGVELATGNALVALGRLPEAVAAFDRAIGLHPGSFRARLNRAEAERMAAALDRAEQDLAVARRLQPGHPSVAAVAERIRKARIDEATGANGAPRPRARD